MEQADAVQEAACINGPYAALTGSVPYAVSADADSSAVIANAGSNSNAVSAHADSDSNDVFAGSASIPITLYRSYRQAVAANPTFLFRTSA